MNLSSRHRSLNFQLGTLELKQIRDEHPLVKKLRNDSSGQLREPSVGVLTQAGLMYLAHHAPLHVVAEGEEFLCIAGVRRLRFFKAGLPEDAVVPVFVYERLRNEELRDHIAFDLFVIPPIFTIHPKDKRRLARAWEALKDSNLFWRALRGTGSKALARMLGCDRRSLQDRRK
jgi:hypothetical protein